MFDKYVGRKLKPRYKYIGLKYAKEHGFPELISGSSYGICFKDQHEEGKEREFLIFRVYFDSRPVYANGRLVPGRADKTISEIVLFGEGYTAEELMEAEKIASHYLELAVENR